MPSENKTERLGLNLWEGSDRPQRNDFNSDNAIIEQVVGDHTENTEVHLSAEEKARVQRPLVTVPYLGDGSAQQVVTLPAEVTAVIIYCDSMPCAVYDAQAGCTKNYFGASMFGGGSSTGVSFIRTTVTVTQDTEAKNGFMNCLNESSKSYRVIGFR